MTCKDKITGQKIKKKQVVAKMSTKIVLPELDGPKKRGFSSLINSRRTSLPITISVTTVHSRKAVIYFQIYSHYTYLQTRTVCFPLPCKYQACTLPTGPSMQHDWRDLVAGKNKTTKLQELRLVSQT